MSDRLRVVVVDDDEVMRAALRLVLDQQPDLEWVGEAGSAAEALALCIETTPDLALVDVRMPGGGVTATLCIRTHVSETQVVAMSANASHRVRQQLADAGAAAFVAKGTPLHELLDVLRRAAAPTTASGPPQGS